MTRILFFTFIFSILMSFTQFGNKDILTELQMKFIKEKYNWKSEEILIINFLQPKENCFYNNNENPKSSIKWWKKFYSNINLNNVSNIYVYSDKISAKNIIDSKTRFEDYNNFLLNNIFNIKKECFGVLVVNNLGEYEVVEGEYSQKQVETLIKKLKR